MADSSEHRRRRNTGALPGKEGDLIRSDISIRRSRAAAERSQAAIDRAEAARRRSESAQRRAEASRQSASAALKRTTASRSRRQVQADERDRTADERDQRADEREAAADERERVADAREAEADRREQLADERERVIDSRQRSIEQQDELPMRRPIEDDYLVDWTVGYRIAAAARAERMADQAEAYAVYLERSVARHGRDERLTIARKEREIAAIERRNAAKLRTAGAGPLQLERIPRLADPPNTPA